MDANAGRISSGKVIMYNKRKSKFSVIRNLGKEKKCNNCLCKECANNIFLNDSSRCDGCTHCFDDGLAPICDMHDPLCVVGYKKMK